MAESIEDCTIAEYNIVINADVGGAYNLYNVAMNGSVLQTGAAVAGDWLSL